MARGGWRHGGDDPPCLARTGTAGFGAEEVVSAPGEAARNPSLAVLPSGEVLIAYETDPVLGVKRIIVASKEPASCVFQTQIIAETAFTGALLPEVGAREGRRG